MISFPLSLRGKITAARDKERAIKEKQEREKTLAAVHQALSTQIQKEMQGLTATLGQVVKTTVESQMSKPQLQAYQTSVATVLLPKIEKAVQDQTRQVAQQQRTEIDRLVASSKDSLAKSFRECFQETLIPAFEQSCQRMFSQIDSTFQRGMSERNEASKRQEDAVLEQLRAGVSSLHDARGLLQQNVAVAAAAAHHPHIPQQPPQHTAVAPPPAWGVPVAAPPTGSIHGDPAALVAGAPYPHVPQPQQQQPQQMMRPPVPFPSAPVPGHNISMGMSSIQQPPQPPISVTATPGALDQWNKAVHFVSERKFDDAFSTVLSMTNLDAVVALCRAVNLRDVFAPLQLSQVCIHVCLYVCMYVYACERFRIKRDFFLSHNKRILNFKSNCPFPLLPFSPSPQVVLLSLMQQLGVDLRTDTELKVAYLKEGIILLDKHHALIGQHIPAIVQQLRLNLRQVTDDPRNISPATIHEMRQLHAVTGQIVPL